MCSLSGNEPPFEKYLLIWKDGLATTEPPFFIPCVKANFKKLKWKMLIGTSLKYCDVKKHKHKKRLAVKDKPF